MDVGKKVGMSTRIRDMANKVYLVVGCHGSATSLVIQGLRRCGIKIGNRVLKDVLEDTDFQNLNKKILRSAGGTWYAPPSEEAILGLDFSEQIKSLLKNYDYKMWGFKDPRISLTGKLLFPHLDGDVYLFCCFRKPDRLVKSLKRKYSEDFDEAFVDKYINKKLIDRYNEGIISLIKEFCEL